MEKRTKTCGSIPGGLILTHSQINGRNYKLNSATKTNPQGVSSGIAWAVFFVVVVFLWLPGESVGLKASQGIKVTHRGYLSKALVTVSHQPADCGFEATGLGAKGPSGGGRGDPPECLGRKIWRF